MLCCYLQKVKQIKTKRKKDKEKIKTHSGEMNGASQNGCCCVV